MKIVALFLSGCLLSLGVQANCLHTLSEFAEQQCGKIEEGGFAKVIEGELKGGAETARLLGVLAAKLEVKGGLYYLDKKYGGVKRSDLKDDRANARACKIEIVQLIYPSECKE